MCRCARTCSSHIIITQNRVSHNLRTDLHFENELTLRHRTQAFQHARPCGSTIDLSDSSKLASLCLCESFRLRDQPPRFGGRWCCIPDVWSGSKMIKKTLERITDGHSRRNLILDMNVLNPMRILPSVSRSFWLSVCHMRVTSASSSHHKWVSRIAVPRASPPRASESGAFHDRDS